LLFPAHARPSRSSCDGELTDLCLLYTRVRVVLWRRSLLRMDTDVVRRCWHPAADQQRCVLCCRTVHMLRAAMRATSHRCMWRPYRLQPCLVSAVTEEAFQSLTLRSDEWFVPR